MDIAMRDGRHDGDEASEPEVPETPVDFVTLGMFIIDDIEYLPPRPPVKDIIGGAGAFAALGARLFSPPPTASRSVGWVVDRGSDFPPAMAALIASWQTAVVLRDDAERLTTRGWNGYETAERRAFRYLTPKRRLTPEDLPPSLLAARAFHIISSAERCRDIITDLMARRKALGGPRQPRPLIVWEPVPDRCSPDELLECTKTLRVVDVCSPNHAELAAYMGDPDKGQDPVTGALSRQAVERACEQLLASMPLQSYALVVRAAEHGCYLATNGGRRRRDRDRQRRDRTRTRATTAASVAASTSKRSVLTSPPADDELPVPSSASSPPEPARPAPAAAQHLHGSLRPDIDMFALLAGLQRDETGAVALSRQTDDDDDEPIDIDPGLELWVPAVFDGSADQTDEKKQTQRVVDPTGGGNAFMGGLAVALARGKTLEEAAAWGNVAASFAIEQVGVPVLGRDADGAETWNGVRVEARWAAYEARLRQAGLFSE